MSIGSTVTRIGLLASALIAQMPAFAQDAFPTRFITLVVPVAAGGPTDVLARRFAEPFSKAVGVPVVVSNVVGAGGAVAYRRVIDSAPDGYTALFANVGITSAPTVLNRPDLDPSEKLDAIAMLGATPITLTVGSSVTAKTMPEFLKYAREKGDALNVAHSGNGSGAHLNAVLFSSVAKLQPTYIPFQGAAPILTALTAGQVDAYLGLTSTDVPLHNAGRVKILAVSSAKRLPALPDIPTMIEAGLPAFTANTWFGLFLPKGAPQSVIAAYERGIAAALEDPTYRKTLEQDFVSQLPDNEHASRAGFTKFVRDEVAQWQSHLKSKLAPPQQ
jgi:tripartite-type tricarboxylate transporter receptor subunit TctC